jgi:hypothetical protein
MGQIERSRFWLDIEFQYWDQGYDQIIKFTIGDTGNIRFERLQNLDPNDDLRNLEVSTLSKTFPRTVNQFLDAILETYPRVFQVPDLCTTTLKGDKETLEKLWGYLDVTDIEKRPIPDDEVEIVRSSRPHLPGKSPVEIREYKSTHGLDFRRMLIIGEDEWGIGEFGDESYAFDLRELFEMEAARVSNPNFTFALHLPTYNDRKFVFKIMNFRREYSLGYLQYHDNSKWVKISGTPGHALARFIVDYVSPFVESNERKGYDENPKPELAQLLSFLVDFPSAFGNKVSMESSSLNLHFKLDENVNDYGTFLSRFRLQEEDLEAVDSIVNFSYQGEFLQRLNSNDAEDKTYEISISRVSSDNHDAHDWQIGYATGFKSISRIFSGEEHLVDILLRVFDDCALYLQFSEDNRVLGFPPANYLPLEGRYALLTFAPESFSN